MRLHDYIHYTLRPLARQPARSGKVRSHAAADFAPLTETDPTSSAGPRCIRGALAEPPPGPQKAQHHAGERGRNGEDNADRADEAWDLVAGDQKQEPPRGHLAESSIEYHAVVPAIE